MALTEFIAALNAKFSNVDPKSAMAYTFEVEAGRKFNRVVQTPRMGGRSVFCFVDNDGNVYKPAGWKAPAKGIRATLATLDMSRVDAYGSWLYRR